jgi:hypothetical protein
MDITNHKKVFFLRRLRAAFSLGFRRCLRQSRETIGFVVSEQLSSRPGRFKTALRIAAMVAVFAALMAIFHVQSGTAQYALWLLVAPPGPMMRPSQTFAFAFAAAGLMALSVPLAGFMAQAPGVMLLFVGLVSAASVYAVNALRLGARGFVLQLIFLEAFYAMVVIPSQAGFQAANTFAGYLVAFLVILLFDAFLWPNPAEPILLESLSASLRREGKRLLRAIEIGEVKKTDEFRPISAVESDISVHLRLLERASQEGLSAQKGSFFLGQIVRAEKIFSQMERLASLLVNAAGEAGYSEEELDVKRVIHAAVEAVNEAADNIFIFSKSEASRLTLSSLALRDRLRILISEIEHFEKRASGNSEGLSKMSGVIISLHELSHILTRPIEEASDAALQELSLSSLIKSPLDPVLLRFSLKTALAVVICFIFGFISHDPRLWVAPVTVFTVAFQSYGTAIRRMFLRLGGSVIGGLLILFLMSVITPNFSALPAYMITAFVVVFIAGYAGQSHEKIAYAGRQIGDVFIIIFVGLGQPMNIYDPFWRISGIFIGILVPLFIYKIFWPQRAGDQIPALLSRFLRGVLEMAPGGLAGDSAKNSRFEGHGATQILADLVNLAGDAELEGYQSGVNSAAVLEASDALWKISHRFSAISLRRMNPDVSRNFSDMSLERDGELSGFLRQLEAWADFFENEKWKISSAWSFASQIQADVHGRRSWEDWLIGREASGVNELALRGDFELFWHLHYLIGKLNAALPAVFSGGKMRGDWRELIWNAQPV